MKKEDLQNIKMVKLYIKNAISNQKWSVKEEKNHKKTFLYLNSINEGISMNDANIKITIKPECKYDSNPRNGESDVKIIISIKTGSYWRDFNAINYGFSIYEIMLMRISLHFKSVSKDRLQQEFKKQQSIKHLSEFSNSFINENKSIFRDSKIDKILKD